MVVLANVFNYLNALIGIFSCFCCCLVVRKCKVCPVIVLDLGAGSFNPLAIFLLL